MQARLLKIKGQVQGVFFRASALEKAHNLGLHGWVRNAEDGSVEIQIEGTEDAINDFTEWCKKGPPSAKVEDVEIHEVPIEGFTEFQIQR